MENERTNGQVNGVYSSPKKSKPIIREPVKLILQLLYAMFAIIPIFAYSVYQFFTPKSISLKGKTVLVTGGARGLGRELCLRFAQEGASVAVVDIEDEGSKETVQILQNSNPNTKVKMYHCSVSSSEEIRRLREDVTRDFGQIDVLVNNAGIVGSASIVNTDDKYMDVMVDVNLKSHFKMAREFLPDMIERNSGHIVGIASLSSVVTVVNLSLYAATKHGVLAFMETLHDELNAIPNNQVRTTCICPYFIKTNTNYGFKWNLRVPELSISYVVKNIVSAVKNNRRLLSIPSGYYNAFLLMRLVPDSIRHLFHDIFYVEITPPSAYQINQNESSSAIINSTD